MTKKSVTLIFMIISIIALIYMFMDYYGIIRYAKMYNSSINKYSENYTKLPKADSKRVIIAFSLDNIKDLDNIKPFLNSILNQTVRVNDIAIILPIQESKKKLCKKYAFLSSYFYSVDYGDSACLITSVLREPESDTKIIIVSPDMIYGKDFVQDIVSQSNNNTDNIIYGRYSDLKQGILVKPKFFTDKISDYDEKKKSAKSCQDWLHFCSNAKIHDCKYGETYKML